MFDFIPFSLDLNPHQHATWRNFFSKHYNKSSLPATPFHCFVIPVPRKPRDHARDDTWARIIDLLGRIFHYSVRDTDKRFDVHEHEKQSFALDILFVSPFFGF